MARKVSVEIVGDATSVERAFNRAGRSANNFGRSTKTAERDFGKTLRGFAAGSGVFSSLGRSLAFASGGFLVFATAAQGLRASVNAAQDAAATQRQLVAQLKVTGKSFATYKGQIDASTASLSQLSGFTEDDLKQAFTTVLRGSGNVSDSLKLTALAADIARGRNVSLAEASVAVGKAAAGSTTALKRLGIELPKGATAAQALALAQQKFAGQAQAGATAADRFNAELHNSEEIIGTAILPTLDRYLTKGALWLQQMNESGKLQRDVASATHAFGQVVGVVTGIVKGIVAVFQKLDFVTGSLANTLKLLAGAWLLLKVRAAAIRWGLLATDVAGVGTAASTAAGDVGLLRGALIALGGAEVLGPLAALGAALILINRFSGKSNLKPSGQARSPGGTTENLARNPQTGQQFVLTPRGAVPLSKLGGTNVIGGAPSTIPTDFLPPGFDIEHGKLVSKKGPGLPNGQQPFKVGPSGEDRQQRALQGQFNLDQLALAKAQAAGNTQLERKILVAEAAILKAQEKYAKSLKDKTAFEQQLVSVEDQIRSIDAAAMSAAKKARDAAKKKSDAAKKLAQSFTVPLELQVADARAQALGKSEVSILKKIRAAAYAALKSGKLGLRGQLAAWNEIASVNSQLQSSAASATAGFKELNTKKIVKSLGLTGEQAKKLRSALSQVGPGGTVPNQGVGAYGVAFGADSKPLVVHTHVNIDGKKVAENTTRHNQKARRRNPSQRRGPLAGIDRVG